MTSHWLSADEAMRRLGVRSQTLYAYVSRGRIAAQPDPSEPRRSRYRASDVDALTTRKARGRKAAAVAADAIAWGEPVLDSAITAVIDGRLFYRGHDAVGLARTETLESAARLLRGGAGAPAPRPMRYVSPADGTPRTRLFAALAARAAVDFPAVGRASDDLASEAATLLDVVADAVTGGAWTGPIHARLGHAWGCGATGMDLLRRALVLLADHELNASTFAARVAASTGAALAASALAGLSALSGPRHGGVFIRVRRWADEAGRAGVDEAVAARRAHRLSAPGFGHPLYPEGDPRARALTDAFVVPPPLQALRAAVEASGGEPENIDFALVALAQTLNLPDDAPFALFAVARCAGWLAHAIEQIETGALIRPRARYVGPAPTG